MSEKKIVAGLGTILLAVNYPKTFFSILTTAAVIVPPIIYELPGIHQFFGITNGSSLDIQAPPVSDIQIRQDEKRINDLREKMKERKRNSKAA